MARRLAFALLAVAGLTMLVYGVLRDQLATVHHFASQI